MPPQRGVGAQRPPQRGLAMIPARMFVLIFMLASSQILRVMRRYPADPQGRPDLPYNLIFVEDGAAATRGRGATAAATRSSGAAAASDTGADVGPDSHISFLSVLRVMRSLPTGPPGPAETLSTA